MRNIQQSILSMINNHNARKRLMPAVCMIAAALVFAVVWSLHINGITLASADPTCGMEEHIHTESCYDWVALDADGEEEAESTEGTESAEAVEGTEGAESAEVTDGSEDTVDAAEEDASADEEIAESTKEETESVTEVADGDATERATEEAAEEVTEELTEEATESPQPGDTKTVDGVTYVYELVCGLEEHTHTDECYESEETEEDSDAAEESDSDGASADDEETVITTAGVATVKSLGASNSTDDDEEEEIISVASLDEDESDEEADSDESDDDEETTTDSTDDDSNTLTSSIDFSDYYLAYTVDAGNLTSGDDYIIYTKIGNYYYVVSADGSLVQCTTVSSLSEAVGDGPFFVESTGTVACALTGSDYVNYYWNVEETGTSGSYYVLNESTNKYMAPVSANDTTVTNFVGSNADTISLSGDFKIVYTFMNQSLGTENYHNYVFKISDSSNNAKCLYVRADNYASAFEDSALLTTTGGFSGGITYSGTFSWDDWLAAMQEGEAVEVTVTRTGTSLQVVMTAADATFTISGTLDSVTDPLTIALTGEKCIITDISRTVYTTSDSGTNYTADSDNTYAKAVSSSFVYSDNQKAVAFVSESSTSGSGVNGAEGTAINYSNLSVSLNSEADGNSGYNAAWESESSAAVFYFAEVQDTADNYHFAETVTLTDAAENQDDSYVVYTKIDDTYYIVSAVDGSLLACTDISDSSYSDDDKVLLSAAAGVYIWDYDGDTHEPEFKFTTGTDDDGEDEFGDYYWTVSSSDYDTTSGTGTYTLENEQNEDYLAPELETNSVTMEGSRNSAVYANDVASLSGYGTIELSVYIDDFDGSSSTGYYTYLQTTVADDDGSSVAVRWSGYTSNRSTSTSSVTWAIPNGAYSLGSISFAVGNTITITIITSENSVCFNFYNENTYETYICVVDGVSFDSGCSVDLYRTYGDYTITTATASYDSSDSSAYGVANSITESAAEADGVYSYTVNSWSQVGIDSENSIYPTRQTLAGDFDITYSFTNASTGSVTQTTTNDDGNEETTEIGYYYNYAIELCDGSSKYIDLRADDTGWTRGCDDAAFTYQTAYADFTSWSDWQKLMESGATCTVRVIRTGDNFFFITTASGTVNGTSVSYTFASFVTVSDFGDSIYVYLMGEQCTLSGITYTNYTARNYNETTYSRLSSSSKSITVTATDEDGTSTSEASYLWTATATGSYSEAFHLIGQLATDTANTEEIDWVENATAEAEATGTATTTLSGASVETLASEDDMTITFSLARVNEYTVHFDPTNGATYNYNTDYNATVYYYADESTTSTTMATSSGSWAVTSYSDAVGNCYVRLANALSSGNYPYDLQGWYDIYNNTYYSAEFVGEEIAVTKHTVMYADWVIGEDYTEMTGKETGASDEDNKIDTSSFITTDVFDYNSLVNLNSAVLYDEATDSEGSYYYATYADASGHLELWGLAASPLTSYPSYSTTKNILGTASWGFLFINNRAGTTSLYTGFGRVGSLSYLLGRNDNGLNAGFEQGIVKSVSDNTGVDLLGNLFTKSSGYTPSSTIGGTGTGTIGVNYLGTGNYLYQYNETKGYYYFDSSKNAAYYYNNRFYLFDCTVKGSATGSEDDFLPFNYPNISSSTVDEVTTYTADTIAYANTNYFFGMKSTVSFYLPDATGTETDEGGYGNQSVAEENMVFRFMGDDDVWVYVDDTLVLDLGGTHDAIYGEIDFSVGKISYITNVTSVYVDDSKNSKTYAKLCFDQDAEILELNDDVVFEESNTLYIYVKAVAGDNVTYYEVVPIKDYDGTDSEIKKISVGYTVDYSTTKGTHTLDFYYLERGASQSNCAIYFSISSANYSLNLAKKDEDDKEYGTQASFSIYTMNDEEKLEILPLVETDDSDDSEDSASSDDSGESDTTNDAEDSAVAGVRLATEDDDESDYTYTFTSSQVISGLQEGELYYIYEVESPEGLTAAGRYFTVILEDDVLTIKVYNSADDVTDTYEYMIEVTEGENGNYVATYNSGSNTSESDDDWKYVDTSDMSVSVDVSGGRVSNYGFTFTIVNTAEYELPSTGSTGIFPYERAGTLLVLVSITGLMATAFYELARVRRYRTSVDKERPTKDAWKCGKRFAGTREHPRERIVTHGHVRDRPGGR